jgi:inorganic pyrophosphatase
VRGCGAGRGELLAGPLAATRLISVMRDLADLPHSPGEGILHVVVESQAGATSKIKWDPELGVFALSRPLPLGVAYPHDWGFVPGTRAADGDPFDALVLSQGSSYPSDRRAGQLQCRVGRPPDA